jgi:hypothetical protein
MTKHRNAIVTLAVPRPQTDLSQLCAIALMNRYAERIRADVVVLADKQTKVPGQDFLQWEKVRAFALLGSYDEVLYLDSDVLVNPAAPNIFESEAGKGGAVCGREERRGVEVDTLKSRGFDVGQWRRRGEGRYRYFNAGVLLLRPGAQEIAARFKPEEAAKAVTAFFDQTYLNFLIQTTVDADELDRKWNWMNMDGADRFGAYFIHHAGAGFGPAREQQIIEDYVRLTGNAKTKVVLPLRMREGGFRAGLEEFVGALPPIGNMAEVGCYQGESTEIFVRKAQRVIAIDPWVNGYDPSDIASENVDAALVEAAFDRRHSTNGRVQKLRQTSLAAAVTIQDGSLDMVYLDGDHRYEAVQRDLKAWLPKLKPRGLMCGHDFWPGNFDGTVAAITEVLGKPDRVFGDSSWMKCVASGEWTGHGEIRSEKGKREKSAETNQPGVN